MSAAQLDDEYINLVRQFPLVPIRSKSQFNEAIKVMKRLAYRLANLNKAESDYLTVLSDLIVKYEKRFDRLKPKITPVQALKYIMKESGLSQADLVPIVVHKSNLSAFLNGKRGLSKTNAVRLGERFKVSPALFLPKV